MVVENKRIEKTCCVYVSDFHLEMILVPYINERIEENIIIRTEKNLKDTVEILISKMNLREENKEKILNLGWNIDENRKLENNSNLIIIGSKKYIEDINNEIQQNDIKNVSVADCYWFEDIEEDIDNIINNYSRNLNTNGFANI